MLWSQKTISNFKDGFYWNGFSLKLLSLKCNLLTWQPVNYKPHCEIKTFSVMFVYTGEGDV